MRQPQVQRVALTLETGVLLEPKASRRRATCARRLAWFVRARIVGALLLVGTVTAGCYRYVPVTLGAVAPKEEVRVRVTTDAAARLSTELGSYSTEINGAFTQEGPDSVSVGVTIDRQYRGTTVGTTTQLLFLGRAEIVEVHRREFSRTRTVLLTAGTAVGFGLLVAGVMQLFNPNGSADEKPMQPPPPQMGRRPGFHFNLRMPIQ